MSSIEDRTYIIDDLKRMMVRIGANERWYDQSWLGVQIWQLPEDLIRLQRAVAEIRPQWIVEIGTKFGGSAIFFSSLLTLLGRTDGGVVTVDITIPETVRETLRTHSHGGLVKAAIEADAAADTTAAEVGKVIEGATGPVLVFLDDNHNAEHVLKELRNYEKFVTKGSYLIVADTVFEDLSGTPVGKSTDKYPNVATSNPRVALRQFLNERSDFIPDPRYATGGPSNFADGFLKRAD